MIDESEMWCLVRGERTRAHPGQPERSEASLGQPFGGAGYQARYACGDAFRCFGTNLETADQLGAEIPPTRAARSRDRRPIPR